MTFDCTPTVDAFQALLPDLRGARTLVIGLGGGADIVTAHAIAQCLDVGDGAAIHANTKTRAEADWTLLSPHLALLPPEPTPLASLRATHGSTGIDRATPRGPDGCPLIVRLPVDRDDTPLTAELAALRFDHVIAVDTGGDVLDRRPRGRRGRDARMLAVVTTLGLPVHLVVVAPGADGQSDTERLSADMLAARPALRGIAPLTPLLAVYRAFAAHLPAQRTPCLIVAAHDAALRGDTAHTVPRGLHPTVPITWMTSMLVLDGHALTTSTIPSRRAPHRP